MHFEILVEDQSGKIALDIFVPKIIGTAHTFRVHAGLLQNQVKPNRTVIWSKP